MAPISREAGPRAAVRNLAARLFNQAISDEDSDEDLKRIRRLIDSRKREDVPEAESRGI